MTINKKVDHKKIWFLSLDGMATGFFLSLIVSFFVGLLGYIPGMEVFSEMKAVLSYLTPFVIGMTIGMKAEKSLYQVVGMGLAAMLVGHSTMIPDVNAMKSSFIDGFKNIGSYGFKTTSSGDAFAAWLVGAALLYVFDIFRWESTFDFIMIPVLTIFIGMAGTGFITFITQTFAGTLGWLLSKVEGERWLLILMSPIIASVMGITLSLPISSAALAIMIGMNGEIATISLAGTSAQMIAWGIITYMANKDLSETTAVGFGTSMFQMKNFVRKRSLFIVPTIASAISGLLAALIFTGNWALFDPDVMGNEFTTSAGMGWAAWYGPVLTIVENNAKLSSWVFLILCQIIVPVVIGIPLGQLFFKKGWYKSIDLVIWTKNNEEYNKRYPTMINDKDDIVENLV